MEVTAGIKSPKLDDTFIGELKQAVLLFDIIGITLLGEFFNDLNGKKRHQSTFFELQLLCDKKILFDAFSLEHLEQVEPYITEDLKGEIRKITPLLNKTTDTEIIQEAFIEDGLTRIASLLLNRCYDMHSIPVLNTLSLPTPISSTKTEVINLFLNSIPIPDDTTPWEAIFDFKIDEDNKGRMAALRKWVNKTVQSNLSPAELRDEIEDLLYRYRKSLDIHKIKHKKGILQTVVVGSAELLENALTLKFSKIAKGLFEINESKADLMNLELNAPGNELAYLYQIQQKF